MGVAVEGLVEHSVAVAPGKLAGLARAEVGVAREARVLEVIKALPRVFGTAKATKSTVGIVEELTNLSPKEERKTFSLGRRDLIIAGICLLALFISVGLQLQYGASLGTVRHSFLMTLVP